MKLRALIATALLGLAACGKAASEHAGTAATIDTLAGGIVRVRNHGPTEWSDTNGWKLVLEQTIQPVPTGPGMLVRPHSIAVSSRGELFVLDRKPAAIKVFSADGHFLRTIGREGAGPGEYGDYGDLLIVNDTLVVNDRANSRIVLFTTDGGTVRTFRGRRLPAEWPATRDGRFPVSAYIAQRPSTPVDNFPGQGAVFYRLDGTTPDSVEFPAQPKPAIWTLKDATHDLGLYVPFAPDRVHTFDRTGLLIWGNQATYEFIVSRTGHDTTRIIDAAAPVQPIPDSLREAEFADALKSSEWATPIAKLGDVPKNYPLWTNIGTDGDNNLWVLRPGKQGDADAWDVFTSDGILRGAVPAALHGLSSHTFWTRDRMYAVFEGKDDAPVVKVFHIVKDGH